MRDQLRTVSLPSDEQLTKMANEPCDQGSIPFVTARAMAAEIARAKWEALRWAAGDIRRLGYT